jgi:hypothetical protein
VGCGCVRILNKEGCVKILNKKVERLKRLK